MASFWAALGSDRNSLIAHSRVVRLLHGLDDSTRVTLPSILLNRFTVVLCCLTPSATAISAPMIAKATVNGLRREKSMILFIGFSYVDSIPLPLLPYAARSATGILARTGRWRAQPR